MPSPQVRNLVALLAALMAGTPVCLAAKKAPPAPEITVVAARDTHDKEKVTMAVEPFETRAKADFFRLDYPGHSLLPVRLIIRNDGDNSLDLADVRIQFIAADGTKLPAATPDEMNRRLFRFKDLAPKRIPGTPITYHSTPVDKKILDDDRDFGFAQTTVSPHSTASGFLIYDVKDVEEPLLRGAEIYVKEVRLIDPKRTELFGFSLPFDKYLAAQKASTDSQKAAEAKKESESKKSEPMTVDTSHLTAAQPR